ncbi:MAG: DUF58 domain-containing protein [Vulcanimicrobiaceae bacterium]
MPATDRGRRLRNALLTGKRRPRLFGSGSPSGLRGDGYEFAELRAYVAGDDPRRIDWAATARSGALQTRVVLEDVALTMAAIVDTSASMRVGRSTSLLDCALDVLRAWFEAVESEDRAMQITARGAVPDIRLRGRAAATAAFAFHANASEQFDLWNHLRIARAILPAGSALLLITDGYDFTEEETVPDGDAMLADLGRRYDMTCLVARDPWYEGLPLRGFVRFKDAQSGRLLDAYIGARQRRAYVEAVARREARLIERLEQARWRAAPLLEGAGPASLYAAFGVGHLVQS